MFGILMILVTFAVGYLIGRIVIAKWEERDGN